MKYAPQNYDQPFSLKTLNKFPLKLNPTRGNGVPISVPMSKGRNGGFSRKQSKILKHIALEVGGVLGVNICDVEWTKYELIPTPEDSVRLGELIYEPAYDNFTFYFLVNLDEALRGGRIGIPRNRYQELRRHLNAALEARLMPNGKKENPELPKAIAYMKSKLEEHFDADHVATKLRFRARNHRNSGLPGYLKFITRTSEYPLADIEEVINFCDGQGNNYDSQLFQMWDVDTKIDVYGTIDVRGAAVLLRKAGIVVKTANIQGNHMITIYGSDQTDPQVKELFPENSELKIYNKIVGLTCLSHGGIQSNFGDNSARIFHQVPVRGEGRYDSITTAMRDEFVQKAGMTRFEDSRKTHGRRMWTFTNQNAMDSGTSVTFLKKIRDLCRPALKMVPISAHFRALADVGKVKMVGSDAKEAFSKQTKDIVPSTILVFDPSIEHKRIWEAMHEDFDASVDPLGGSTAGTAADGGIMHTGTEEGILDDGYDSDDSTESLEDAVEPEPNDAARQVAPRRKKIKSWACLKRLNPSAGIGVGAMGGSNGSREGGAWHAGLQYARYCTNRDVFCCILTNGHALRTGTDVSARLTCFKLTHSPSRSSIPPVVLVKWGKNQDKLTLNDDIFDRGVSWRERGFPIATHAISVPATRNRTDNYTLRVADIPRYPFMTWTHKDARKLLWNWHKTRFYLDFDLVPMNEIAYEISCLDAAYACYSTRRIRLKRKLEGPEHCDPQQEEKQRRAKHRRLQNKGLLPKRKDVQKFETVPRNVWLTIGRVKHGQYPWAQLEGVWYSLKKAYDDKYQTGKLLKVYEGETVRFPGESKRQPRIEVIAAPNNAAPDAE